MKHIIPILAILLFLASCNSSKKVVRNAPIKNIDTTKKITYNRVLKSNDYNLKYKIAQEYYNSGKYLKALDLYEQLVPFEKGQIHGDEVYYLYAMCNYQTGDYLFAGYHFKTFYNMYPTSPFAEHALFMSAFCYLLDSPRWSLDQTPTTDAITQFQLFLSKFPQSDLVDSCNHLVDTLRYKLEKKSFKSAELYYNLGYYNAADIALSNSIKDYPDSPFAEDALFTIIKSNQKYANGSINTKQDERFYNTITNCKRYQQLYPNGRYSKDVERISQQTEKKLTKTSK